MANVILPVTVGEFYFDLTGYTYYGHDSGPNAFYGDIGSSVFVGLDGKEYIVHAIRWAAESPNNRVYMRLDNSTISATDNWQTYAAVFGSITVGSTTLSSGAIVSGFTVDGGVGLYWNVVSNPFGSVGGITNLSLNSVLSGAYGLEIYNSSGTVVISITKRLPRFVASGTTSANSGQTATVFVTGMSNNDSWNVLIAPIPSTGPSVLAYNVSKFTGFFTIQNTSAVSMSYEYWILRS